MNSISIKYSLIWEHKAHSNYQFTRCKKCFNVNRGKEIKMVLNGGSIGFWIAGKFEPLSKIKTNLVKIKEYDCPF